MIDQLVGVIERQCHTINALTRSKRKVFSIVTNKDIADVLGNKIRIGRFTINVFQSDAIQTKDKGGAGFTSNVYVLPVRIIKPDDISVIANLEF